MNNGELTAKQDRFCEEYLLDLNATQAAIRAGYSQRSAASIGDENLDKPQIRKHICRLRISRSRRTWVRADRVIKELEKIGFAGDSVKTSDRIKALGMLGKHMGLFEKHTSQPPGLTPEDHKSEIPPDSIFEEGHWFDALTPKEQERMFGAVDRFFGKIQDEEQDTTETGLEAGDSDEDEIDDFDPED